MHGVLKCQWQATATATALCVDVASHFASGQRLFAYAAGQDEPGGMSRVGSRARQARAEVEAGAGAGGEPWLLGLCLHSAFLVH